VDNGKYFNALEANNQTGKFIKEVPRQIGVDFVRAKLYTNVS
jgi:hypothetical protein